MKRTTVVLTSILFAALLSSRGGHAETFDDGAAVLGDHSIVICFSHLVSRSFSGFVTSESAAFLVMQADGTIGCLDWPSTHDFKQARWSGPLPDRVVAMAHTHPLSSPQPSIDDVKVARQMRLPSFVLTPNMITVIHPDGRVQILTYRTWMVRHR